MFNVLREDGSFDKPHFDKLRQWRSACNFLHECMLSSGTALCTFQARICVCSYQIDIIRAIYTYGEGMQKKLTITIDEDVYAGLHQVVGRRKISRFIESLVRPYVIYGDLQEGYRQMAADTEREVEAMEWIKGTAEEIRDEAR